MLQINPKSLPHSDELISSDEIPLDNEDQNWVPNVLLFLLEHLWKDREDWFFAVDMGLYHTTGPNPRVPVVPDGFLALGVERRKGGSSRSSYVTWEEQNITPTLTLEVVSQTPGGEYDEKIATYAKLGVQYYIIYNPRFWQRDGHFPLEIYKLVSGAYQLQTGEPFWMPEIGLGIGRCVLPTDALNREALSWFDEKSDRHLSAEEQERQAKEQALQRSKKLEELLRSKGIDPNQLLS